MDSDIAMALNSELSFLLQEGWDLIQETERFRIRARFGTLSPIAMQQALRQEVWRIAQFVAYSHFVSIAKNTENSYTIESRMNSGDGFVIIVESAP